MVGYYQDNNARVAFEAIPDAIRFPYVVHEAKPTTL